LVFHHEDHPAGCPNFIGICKSPNAGSSVATFPCLLFIIVLTSKLDQPNRITVRRSTAFDPLDQMRALRGLDPKVHVCGEKWILGSGAEDNEKETGE